MLKCDPLKACIEGMRSTYDKMMSQSISPVGKTITPTTHIELLEVSAIIPFVGELKGSMLISYTAKNAMVTASTFMGFTCDKLDEDVLDCTAEIVNIASGAAAGMLEPYRVGLGLPNVMSGQNQSIRTPSGSNWQLIEMTSTSIGNFLIGVSLEES